MAGKKERETSQRVTVRIRPQLLQRLDAYAADLDLEVEGVRGVAIRKLLALGLKQAGK